MSQYAAKAAQLSQLHAHIDQWNIFFWITLFWAATYFIFFAWMGIVGFQRGLKEVPHAWGILWAGLVFSFALMFFAVSRYIYWQDALSHFNRYFT